MRRWLSLALLFVLGFGPAAPLLALGGDAEQKLPICCRRNGVHKCNMPGDTATDDSQQVTVRARCAAYPGPATAAPSHTMSGPHFAPIHAGAMAQPSPQEEAESWARVAREGARQKRGPPTPTLG